MMKNIPERSLITFMYKNHSGKVELRTVMYRNLQFGSNEYYTEPTFLLNGFCLDRQAYRSFSVNNITDISVQA